jgi:hypothetical protein
MKPRIKRIHVNQHVIRRNRREDEHEPPLRVKMSDRNIPGSEIEIEGPARIVYSPERPLSCGARVWIETRAPLRVLDGDGVEMRVD